MEQPTAELTGLPNIGKVAAAQLTAVGIDSPEELARVGAVAAALRLAEAHPDDPPCRSKLCALAGAIRGVRWHSIPKPERDRLWQQYAEQR